MQTDGCQLLHKPGKRHLVVSGPEREFRYSCLKQLVDFEVSL